ncbi:MAG: hypothetical protein QNJ98_15015 [Planctomycetota bacterium]|nr:hypothetical protein [Planctomycetota bacterium]
MRRVFGHCLFAVLIALGALAWSAPDASADEIFELENGVILKGYVMREEGDEITIRLTGFAKPSTVTVTKNRVRKRYAADLPTTSSSKLAPPVYPTKTPGSGGIQASVRPPDLDEDPLSELPADEPDIEDETFVGRFLRLAEVGLPETPHGKATIALLLLVVLMVLINGGARLADVDDLSFLSTLLLAGLLGGFLIADLLQYETLLRADRAIWVLPVQAVTWTVAARLLLGGSIGRSMLVFAFTIVSLLTVVFATGAVFVAV